MNSSSIEFSLSVSKNLVVDFQGGNITEFISRCFIRNYEIVNKADKVITFIKNNSRGITYMINYTLSRGFVIGKNLFIYNKKKIEL